MVMRDTSIERSLPVLVAYASIQSASCVFVMPKSLSLGIQADWLDRSIDASAVSIEPGVPSYRRSKLRGTYPYGIAAPCGMLPSPT